MTFTWLDCVVLFVMIMSAGLGANRGIIKDGLSLTGWIGGGLLALMTYKPAAVWLQDKGLNNEFIAQIAAFIGIILISVVICTVIAYILTAGVEQGLFYRLDHILGLFFGLVRGLAILVLATFAISKLGLTKTDWWQEAFCSKYLTRLSDKAQQCFPKIYQSILNQDKEQQA